VSVAQPLLSSNSYPVYYSLQAVAPAPGGRSLGRCNLGVNGAGDIDSFSLSLAADGAAVATWQGEAAYLDIRFLNGNSMPLVDPRGPINSASLKNGNLAPGSMATISGQNLAASAAAGQAPGLPTNLAGTSVSTTDSLGTTNGTGTVSGWTVQTFTDGSSQVTSISPGVPISFDADTVFIQLTVLATGVHHASVSS
jgi:hypothetical protein